MEKKYFIIDDDIMQNEILSILLKKVDPEAIIHSFTSSDSAFEAIDTGIIPDIILLDLHIPGESETHFLEGHKSRNCSGNIYLMSSAAYLDQPELKSDYPAVRDFISKPLLDHKLKVIVSD